MAKKAELINILVEEYGYEKEDLKFDAEGKPYTNAKLQALIQAEIDDAKALEASRNRLTVKPENVLKDEDKITVMSGSTGAVVYHSLTSNKSWKFTEFGQTATIPYGELVAIKNRYPRYFKDGWFIILDEQVQEDFGLTEMYKNILTPDNMEEVFSMDINELSMFIDKLPEGMKVAFVNKAQELYDQDKIDRHSVIKLIEQKFQISLDDNSPLDDFALRTDTGVQNIIYINKR
ncbi:hypothetical protein IEN91_04580 [Bacillus velezensis]|uniref:hypothetical protein n=1 Tax=Bacillus velezensis TaxID=492670 RepID=UPI0018C795E0|nr:hypothetical protein [Bacillus velezensis]QPK89731.1 hypothetical protein IEN91_04580 [Bacillus velezensis]